MNIISIFSIFEIFLDKKEAYLYIRGYLFDDFDLDKKSILKQRIFVLYNTIEKRHFFFNFLLNHF